MGQAGFLVSRGAFSDTIGGHKFVEAELNQHHKHVSWQETSHLPGPEPVFM